MWKWMCPPPPPLQPPSPSALKMLLLMLLMVLFVMPASLSGWPIPDQTDWDLPPPPDGEFVKVIDVPCPEGYEKVGDLCLKLGELCVSQTRGVL